MFLRIKIKALSKILFHLQNVKNLVNHGWPLASMPGIVVTFSSHMLAILMALASLGVDGIILKITVEYEGFVCISNSVKFEVSLFLN